MNRALMRMARAAFGVCATPMPTAAKPNNANVLKASFKGVFTVRVHCEREARHRALPGNASMTRAVT